MEQPEKESESKGGVRLNCLVFPNGLIHAIGGDQKDGDPRDDLEYIGLKYILRRQRLATEALILVNMKSEYIAYLARAEEQTIGFLHAHNWKYDPEFLAEGEKLRAGMAVFEASLKKMRDEIGTP